MTKHNRVAILGIFVADLAFRASRPPAIGETIIGSGFAMGPGGKGSNQAVAAARAGAHVAFISKLGADSFGDIALKTWQAEGIETLVPQTTDNPTGVAYIFVNDRTGENAIIVVPGAAGTISPDDIESARASIETASVFVTQLEQPIPAAVRALEIARAAGVTTILNPAPAAPLDRAISALCDYMLTGIEVVDIETARKAGDVLLSWGCGCALITLGEKGSLFHSKEISEAIPVFSIGPAIDTTGAGDAFNGGFAAALSRGMAPIAAARFASATAGISVTRSGTAPAMPTLAEIEALLAAKA